MSRKTRPFQLLDAYNNVIPFSPADQKAVIAYVSDLYTFYGYGRPGALQNEASWRIVRETKDVAGNTVNIDFANGSNDYIHIWDSSSAVNISGATQANPCVITAASIAGLADGDIIYISGIGGMTELNGRYFKITLIPATLTFSLQSIDESSNINSTGYGAYTLGGSFKKVTFANYSFS